MEKWTPQRYAKLIRQEKQAAHDEMKLYILINAKELQEECEPNSKNLSAVCQAMLGEMLEGDSFEDEPKTKSKVAGKLTIRYYVDNLAPSRKKYTDASSASA